MNCLWLVVLVLEVSRLCQGFSSLDYLDESVNPCENFYQFACGNFKNHNEAPMEGSTTDHFTIVQEDMVQIGREILSNRERDDDPVAVKKVKAAYSACVNTDYSDQLDVPEMTIIEELGGMPFINGTNQEALTWAQIGDLIGQYAVPFFLEYSVAQLGINSYMLMIREQQSSRPASFQGIREDIDKSYDQILEASFLEIARNSIVNPRMLTPIDDDPLYIFFKEVLDNILRSVNVWKSEEEIDKDLDDMRRFMAQLYAGGIVDKEVPSLIYFQTISAIQEWTETQFGPNSGIDWLAYFRNIFKRADMPITLNHEVYVPPNFDLKLYGILNLFRQTKPSTIKNFVLLRIFTFLAPDSDGPTRSAFERYYRAIKKDSLPRWEYCTRKIMDLVDSPSLGYALTHDYQRYHFNINKIRQSADIIEHIRRSYSAVIAQADWLDEITRNASIRKIEKILVLLSHPEFVDVADDLDTFYQNVRICKWDHYGNSQRMRAFRQAYHFSKWHKQDRAFWDYSAFQVNAIYNGANNKFILPIAMLNDVFLDGNDTLLDYSRLGTIVGHEMSHAFDNNGLQYDEDGYLFIFWNNESKLKHQKKSVCFEEQYSQFYVPEIKANVNGKATINENFADNLGMKVALHAFKQTLKQENSGTNLKTEKFTDWQKFFLSYATMWCSQNSVGYLEKLSDSAYAPTEVRVLGTLSNTREFAEAFQCPVGSPMNPTEKCAFW